jgi:hypothetical protein
VITRIIDPVGDGVDDRHDEEETRSPHGVEAAQAQNYRAIPLICDLDSESHDGADDDGNNDDPGAPEAG